MSLILDALRKLERDKSAPQRGFLIVGAAAARSGGGRLLAIAVLAAVAAAAGAIAWRIAKPAAPAPAALPAPAPADGNAPAPLAAERTEAPVAALPPPVTPAQPRALGEPRAVAPEPERSRVPRGTAQPAAAEPQRPAPAAAPKPDGAAISPPYRLEAISRRDGESVAILNGRLVRVGDSVDGVRVLRIDELEVEIEAAGERIVLHF